MGKKNVHNITIPVNRVLFLQNLSPVTYTNLKHSILQHPTVKRDTEQLTHVGLLPSTDHSKNYKETLQI